MLAALPPEELAQLWPRLEPVGLEFREIVQWPERPSTTVYFPESGCLSVLAPLKDGDSVEVGQIGREGMLGLPVLLSDECSELEVIVQQSGTALCLSGEAFREALNHLPGFRILLLRYTHAQYVQAARTAACNGRHQLDQRLARWLLMTHDRADGDTYAMTHELLSIMLGVRRAGVTVAALALQRAGLIRYNHGSITITDRIGLEASACECYAATRRAFDRLFHPNAQPGDERRHQACQAIAQPALPSDLVQHRQSNGQQRQRNQDGVSSRLRGTGGDPNQA